MVRTVFRPSPTRSVDGASVVVATTAPESAGRAIRSHLETLGCEVIGISHSLSDRERLEEELDGAIRNAPSGAGKATLLCEIKAAGVDTATRWALDRGHDVVYMDNLPVGIEGDDPEGAVSELWQLARTRFQDA